MKTFVPLETLTASDINNAFAEKAALAGSASQTFSVAPATAADHAVQLSQIGGAASQNGTFTATLTGMTAPVTQTWSYRILNKVCTISRNSAGNLVGTSNAVTFTVTGIPAACVPISAKLLSGLMLTNNSATVSDGFLVISAGGNVFTMGSAAFGTGAWTNSGNKGLWVSEFSYTLD